MVEITTPPGRIVWGHPTSARNKTRKNPTTGAFEPVLKDGQPVKVWSFGIAYPKEVFRESVWPAMSQEVATLFPQGAPQKFAWKYVDGDTVDAEGKPYAQREGYAGCYVLALSTELMAPPLFKLVNGAYQQLAPDAVKCGDWVSAGINMKANAPPDRTMTPGLYMNPMALEFIGYGTEIQSQGTADPNALFRGRQHQLPPGASATPLAPPSGASMPGMGQQPGAMPQGVQPQPGYAPQPAGMPGQGYPQQPQPGYPPQGGYAPQPGAMPAPAHDFVQNAGMPGQGYPQQPQPGYPPQGGYAPQPGPQPGAMPQGGQPQPRPGMMPAPR